MTLTERLLTVALLGAEWVLWLLIGLSVISVAIMIERFFFFRSTAIPFDKVQSGLRKFLGERQIDQALKLINIKPQAIESQVIAAGLGRSSDGAASMSEAMVGAKARGKLRLQRNLAYLGTLGNNAPFIGLFGTVIGVIKAFHDLASKKGTGPEVVMGSLSEALIATAMGLLVAIPAVIAFNYYQGRVRERLAHADALAHDVLAEFEGPDGSSATTKPTPAEAK